MLCGNYILSNRSEWTFYFLSSVQFHFTIGDNIKLKVITKLPLELNEYLSPSEMKEASEIAE